MSKEVNFEKRGRLEDHIDCPVTGWCRCCCYHCKPKKILASILFVLFLLFPILSNAQTINYNIEVLDTPIVDLNRNAVLTDDEIINLRNGRRESVVCPGSDFNQFDNTVPNRLNDNRLVVGYCFQPGIGDVAFIKYPNRPQPYSFFQAGNSSSTFFFGLSECNQAAGQFHDGNYHGLLWDGTQLRTVDFPIAGAQTALLAVNCNLIALGAYFTYNPINNEASEWTEFLWSNGNFFPLDFFPLDSNEDGLNLGVSNAGGGGGPSFPGGIPFIEDDGVFKSLNFPPTIDGLAANFRVAGLNEKGQLGGALTLRSCLNPAQPLDCTVQARGFIATPEKEKVKGKR